MCGTAVPPSFFFFEVHLTKEHEVVASAEARPLLVRLHPISLRHSLRGGGGGGGQDSASSGGADRVDLCGPARKDGGAARAWLLPRRDVVDMSATRARALLVDGSCAWRAGRRVGVADAALVDVVLAAAGWFVLGRSQGRKKVRCGRGTREKCMRLDKP